MDPSSSSSSASTGPSNLKTPQMDQSEFASFSTPTSSSTPSRQAFPRRLSLLQNDTSSSPAKPASKPLTETPRRSKRSSISYISSPAVAPSEEVSLSRAPSTSSTSSRTRTGSISRATASSSRRIPSSTTTISDAGADDWLMNDEDTPSTSMAQRDSAKVEALFNDTGYREGITAGKLSTLQAGFDQGFNEVGAPMGERLGLLKGQVAALLLLTSSTAKVAAKKGAGRKSGANLPGLSEERAEEARLELKGLAESLDAVRLEDLAEPDYEAMEHEREHQDGGEVRRETSEEKMQRKNRLVGITERVASSTNRSDPSSSQNLLRLIAAQERRCFELREELASSESTLQQLRSAWQRLASHDLPPTATQHRRADSTTSSSTTSDVAVEAWNSISSKLPGSLKQQLGMFLESISTEKEKEKGAGAVDGGMLRPGGVVSGGLSVLEEEGSDVGSVASPRSPRAETSPNTTITAKAPQDESDLLGFHVDSNGIAHPQPPPPPTSEVEAGGGSTFASMFAKRLKEARTNASDLLREAERKLGNAMTIDDFLSLSSPQQQPKITLQHASSTDSTPAKGNSWAEAARGSRSPNLHPRRSGEEVEGRLSISSTSSRGSAGAKGESKAMSPVIGGVPGAAGVWGMLMGEGGGGKRQSGDSWSWGAKEEDDDGWDRN
ncbi:NADH:ubiquinone reductase (non-electrogenic) [Pseudozyma hubeiensis]|nr:NADH:ubiquinone reductase (non-electrogenic) [Pseudozyma hubeiensis]